MLQLGITSYDMKICVHWRWLIYVGLKQSTIAMINQKTAQKIM
jgi:hypothetical protein